MAQNNRPAKRANRQERRADPRHSVDTSAKLLLIRSGIRMKGRIVNLSQGGCRIRTDQHFNVGIYVRIEAEFYLHGLPFRVAGVSQAILDRNTIGIRFLEMSVRCRKLLTELMEEIAEAEASGQSDATVIPQDGDGQSVLSTTAGHS